MAIIEGRFFCSSLVAVRIFFSLFCLPFSVLTKRQPTPYTTISGYFFLLQEASVIKQKGEKKMTTIFSFSLVFANYGKSNANNKFVLDVVNIYTVKGRKKKRRTDTRNLTRRKKKDRNLYESKRVHVHC